MKKNIIAMVIIVVIIVVISAACWIIYKTDAREVNIGSEETIPYNTLESADSDDEFSENVLSTSGGVFFYKGYTVSRARGTLYTFYYWDWTEEAVSDFSRSINESSDCLIGKSEIFVCQNNGSASYSAFALYNTSDDSLDKPDYDGFYRLRTNEMMLEWTSSYLSLISSLEGIRKLETSERFLKESEENGIDWYEVWPELEEIIVFETDK